MFLPRKTISPETMLEGEAVDSLPIKTVGELARAVRDPSDPDDAP